MIGGTAYGTILNDRVELDRRGASFAEAPYQKAPDAPVLYIKPRNTFAASGSAVAVPADLAEVEVAPTLALLFGERPNVPIAAALALDICEPHESYYRPAIRQRCRDGFLPLGRFADWHADLAGLTIRTAIDGAPAHEWSLDRLLRGPLALAETLRPFMSLVDGDVLLVGLPGDAPRARAGQAIRVEAATLPALAITLVSETAA